MASRTRDEIIQEIRKRLVSKGFDDKSSHAVAEAFVESPGGKAAQEGRDHPAILDCKDGLVPFL